MTVDLTAGVTVEVHQPLPPQAIISAPVSYRSVLPVRGPQGLPGIAGGGYVHVQSTPLATWTVNHGLGKRIEPVVFLDPDLTVPVWADLEYPDANTTVVIFDQPVSGFAEF